MAMDDPESLVKLQFNLFKGLNIATCDVKQQRRKHQIKQSQLKTGQGNAPLVNHESLLAQRARGKSQATKKAGTRIFGRSARGSTQVQPD
jgi:hypothetical protein